MNFTMTIPADTLRRSQVEKLEQDLVAYLLIFIGKNFPEWKEKLTKGEVCGGEITVQTFFSISLNSLKKGIHLCMSLVSPESLGHFRLNNKLEGLVKDIVELFKSEEFMSEINIFVQISLPNTLIEFSSKDLGFDA